MNQMVILIGNVFILNSDYAIELVAHNWFYPLDTKWKVLNIELSVVNVPAILRQNESVIAQIGSLLIWQIQIVKPRELFEYVSDAIGSRELIPQLGIKGRKTCDEIIIIMEFIFWMKTSLTHFLLKQL